MTRGAARATHYSGNNVMIGETGLKGERAMKKKKKTARHDPMIYRRPRVSYTERQKGHIVCLQVAGKKKKMG